MNPHRPRSFPILPLALLLFAPVLSFAEDFYVLQDGVLTQVQGDPSTYKPDSWRIKLYRKGQSTGADQTAWGAIDEDSYEKCMSSLKDAQMMENGYDKLFPNNTSKCTYFNYVGPIAVMNRSHSHLYDLERQLDNLKYGMETFKETYETVRFMRTGFGEPKPNNPYAGIGNVVKEYKDNLEDALERLRDLQDHLKRISDKGAWVVQQLELANFEAELWADTQAIRADQLRMSKAKADWDRFTQETRDTQNAPNSKTGTGGQQYQNHIPKEIVYPGPRKGQKTTGRSTASTKRGHAYSVQNHSRGSNRAYPRAGQKSNSKNNEAARAYADKINELNREEQRYAEDMNEHNDRVRRYNQKLAEWQSDLSKYNQTVQAYNSGRNRYTSKSQLDTWKSSIEYNQNIINGELLEIQREEQQLQQRRAELNTKRNNLK